MKSFAQSSLVEVPFEKVFDYLHVPAHNVGLDAQRPTLHAYIPHDIQEGGEVKYNLFYGLINISWVSTITAVVENTLIKTSATKGPFTSWEATHSFESFYDKVLIRDEFHYSTENENLGKILDSLVVNHAFDDRMRLVEEAETTKIRIVNKDVG
ncbi:MAG: hypothetical protein OCD01_12495 [Fibrobacterales bacterium]